MTMTGERAPAPPPVQTPPGGRWRRLRLVVLVVVALLVPVAWSVGHALTAPGTDSTAARIAEWGRDHHAGWLVSWLERQTYTPPKVGGAPSTTSPLIAEHPASRAVRTRGLPPAVVPPAQPALPGEGAWRVLARRHGAPALAAAYVRPDAMRTSYTAGLVWMSPRDLRAVFHPGTQQPGGGGWPVAPEITAQDRAGLVGVFNSAFRLQDSRGGFYGYGRTLSPLRSGVASMVITRDGSIRIGAWGSEVSMTPDTQIVRQNLVEIVDHGAPAAGLARNIGGRWGATLGNSLYVWRSGIGQRADGSIVFVAGNRLSASTLADLMVRAGVVRGMELDINPEWTSFVLYRNADGQPFEHNLLPDMQRRPSRYDTTSTRDFVALYLR